MTAIQLNTARHHGLSLTGLQILLILAEQGPQDLTALAAGTGITNAAVTGASQKLIAKHLIRRIRDRWLDGRMVVIDLTELGRVRIHQITGAFPEPPAGADRRVDCGICPDCGQGHGHTLMRSSVAIPL